MGQAQEVYEGGRTPGEPLSWPGQFFNPICCFLLFNVMDWLGRSLTSYFLWVSTEEGVQVLWWGLREHWGKQRYDRAERIALAMMGTPGTCSLSAMSKFIWLLAPPSRWVFRECSMEIPMQVTMGPVPRAWISLSHGAYGFPQNHPNIGNK